MKKILISIFPVLLAACGGDSGDSGNMSMDQAESAEQSQSGSQSGSLSVTDAVNTADAMMAVAVVENHPVNEPVTAPSKSVVTTDYEDSIYGMGGYYGATPRGFLQRQIDPTSDGGLLNRFNQTVSENFCLLSQLLPATAGVVDLAPDGDVLTLTAADLGGANATLIQAACPRLNPIAMQRLADQAPLSVYYRVEDLTAMPESQYEFKISVGWNQNTYSDFVYFTAGDDQLKLLAVQTNVLRPGKGSSYAALESDFMSGIVKFESHSLHLGSQADRHDVYRVYANTKSDESLILARSNNDRLDSDSIVAVAKAVGDGPLAVSFDIEAAADIRDLSACIDRDDLSLVPLTAQAQDCDGVPVAPASQFTAQDLFTSKIKSDFARINEAVSLQFDSEASLLSSAPIN